MLPFSVRSSNKQQTRVIELVPSPKNPIIAYSLLLKIGQSGIFTVDTLPFDVWGYFFTVDGSGNPIKSLQKEEPYWEMINNRIEYQQILIPKKDSKSVSHRHC